MSFAGDILMRTTQRRIEALFHDVSTEDSTGRLTPGGRPHIVFVNGQIKYEGEPIPAPLRWLTVVDETVAAVQAAMPNHANMTLFWRDRPEILSDQRGEIGLRIRIGADRAVVVAA